MNLMDTKPIISSDVFLAPNASLIGNVEVQQSASIWYGAVVRADTAPISIGAGASIGDRVVIRGATLIGPRATIEPSAVIDGAKIGEGAVVGAGAVLGQGCSLGVGSILRPGTFLPNGVSVNDGEIWQGAPAQFVANVDDEMRANIERKVEDTLQLASAHAAECGKTHEQIEAEKLRQQLMDQRTEDYNSHMGLLGKEEQIVETQARVIEADREEQRKVGAM